MFKADGFKIVIFSGRNDRGFFATKKMAFVTTMFLLTFLFLGDKFKDKSWRLLMEIQLHLI